MSDPLRALGMDLIEGFGAEQLALKSDMFAIGNAVSHAHQPDGTPNSCSWKPSGTQHSSRQKPFNRQIPLTRVVVESQHRRTRRQIRKFLRYGRQCSA